MKKHIQNKQIVVFSLITFVLSILFFTTITKERIKTDKTEQHEYDPDEHPTITVSHEEMLRNQNFSKKIAQKGNIKAGAFAASSYANGAITGTWDNVEFITGNAGYRVDGSLYDKENDVLYIISYAGHLYRIDRDETTPTNTQWKLIDNKYNYRIGNQYVEGFNLADGSFRIVRSNSNYLQYSDDEGRTWSNSNVRFQWNATMNDAAIAKDQNGNNRIAIIGADTNSLIKAYFSNDGITYTASSLTVNIATHEAKIIKPLGSNDIYLFKKEKATSKIEIFKCGPSDSDYTLVQSPTFSFNTFDRLMGTVVDGVTHFYIAGGNKNLHYSSDGGATWTTKSTNTGDGTVRSMHATKPNIVFKGNTDSNVSTDFGGTFTGFDYWLGWDVQHMKMHEKNDGSVFQVIGNDFGAYISYTPEDKATYIPLNNSSSIQMCYDAAFSPNYGVAFMATQDRGARDYNLFSNKTWSGEIRSTDALRIQVANDGASVWTWMYFGSMYHKDFAMPNPVTTSVYFTGNWWSAPIVASKTPNEDAIYIVAGNKLKKMTYNPITTEIIQTEHYFNFNDISGFEISEANPEIWYASIKSGDFLYSEDGGQNFKYTTYTGTKPTTGGGWAKNQHVIKSSAIDENKVYYAGNNNVFLISNDKGKTFTNHVNGFWGFKFNDFVLSSDEKFIFAACDSSGAWVYSVDEDKWYSMADESTPNVRYTDVEYIAKTNQVIFSTFGSGVLKFNIDSPEQEILAPINLNIESITIENSLGKAHLTWNDQSNNETGFIIERAVNGDFIDFTTLAANTTSYIDSNFPFNKFVRYRVKAINSNTESYYSNYILTNKSRDQVKKGKWTLVSVTSEESAQGDKAIYAFDGSVNSKWHTQWSSAPLPNYPHELVIDRNETTLFKGFTYLPRQDASYNGTIKDYKFYVSNDNINWQLLATGTWEKSKSKKEVLFSNETSARYIKLVAVSEVNGHSSYASCAELDIIDEVSVAVNNINAPQIIQGGRISNSEIELKWLDLSNNEDGFKIEEFINDAFVSIAQVAPNETTYKISNVDLDTMHEYRITAFNNDNDAFSKTIIIKPSKSTKWTLVSATSEESAQGDKAIYAFDGSVNSKWHTQWSSAPLPNYPHELVIDRNETTLFKGFTYLPRQDASYNGTIKDYKFYVSNDNINWQLLATGTWEKSKSKKEVLFSNETSARYIKLVAVSEVNGHSSYASCAELDIITGKLLSLENTAKKNIKVYPNPTKGHFKITVPTKNKKIDIIIYTLTGAIVSSKTYDVINDKVIVNLTQQPSGIFYAKILLEKPFSVKIIKQ